MRPAARLYRAALICYPKDFRRASGVEMTETFLDALDATPGGTGATLRFLARTGRDLLVNGLSERWRTDRNRTPVRSASFRGHRSKPETTGGLRENRRLPRTRPDELRPPPPTPGPEKRKKGILNGLTNDLRGAIRALLQNSGFTGLAVLTLALAVGANTAIFSVVDTVLLGTLPFRDPDRIVLIGGVEPGNDDQLPSSAADFLDFRAQSDSFEEMILQTANARFALSGADRPEEVQGLAVSEGYFEVFGIEPRLGRAFRPEEDIPGNDAVAILGDGLWRRHFGGDPDIVGAEIELSGLTVEVIGVLPPGLEAQGIDLLVPLALSEQRRANRVSHYLMAYGRLKPDVTLEQAQTEMSGIAARLAQAYPESNTGRGVNLVPIHEIAVGPVRSALLVLQGAVGFVLLIACANVANFMLSRGIGRQRELAVRAALGAGRLQLVRQLLVESLVVSLLGGLAGLLVAAWGIPLLERAIPDEVPAAMFGDIGLDLEVLGFALALAVLTGLLFGWLPAWRGSRAELTEALREGDGRGGTGRSSQRAGWVLAVAQVAMALVLLIGAGLLVRSFERVRRVDLGFDTDNVLTFQISRLIRSDDPPWRQQVAAFWAELTETLGSVPGVESAAVAQVLPLQSNWSNGFQIEGRDPFPAGEGPLVEWRAVSADYFETLRIPLRAGRAFVAGDGVDRAPVAIINEVVAERHFAGENPIGRRIQMWYGNNPSPWLTIVGVAAAVRHGGIGEAPRMTIYEPFAQAPQRTMQVVVRTHGEPLAMLEAVQRRLWEIDPDQPVAGVTTLRRMLDDATWQWRVSSQMLGIFSLLAALLAGVGIYGVLAYGVARRTREIGVRMSLGATASSVLQLVVGRGLAMAAAGIALGVAGALATSRLLGGLLYDVDPFDPLTYTLLSIGVVAITALASAVPARRAARVDPMIALRSDNP